MKERRRFARTPASGPVLLRLNPGSPAEALVHARLIDVSDGGFRCSHHCRDLSGGQEVGYSHPLGQGTAQVVWCRISQTEVESGMLILSKHF